MNLLTCRVSNALQEHKLHCSRYLLLKVWLKAGVVLLYYKLPFALKGYLNYFATNFTNATT